MEHDVIFFSDTASLEKPLVGRLIQLAPDSTAVILRFEATGENLLLGDMRLIAPEVFPVPVGEELAALGLDARGKTEASPSAVRVFCRMSIPFERPQDAGFDLGRLVFVCGDRALAVERPGAPVVPLSVKR